MVTEVTGSTGSFVWILQATGRSSGGPSPREAHGAGGPREGAVIVGRRPATQEPGPPGPGRLKDHATDRIDLWLIEVTGAIEPPELAAIASYFLYWSGTGPV